MLGTWQRDDVSSWLVQRVEQIGSTRNLWLEEPDTEFHWLHKDTTIPANGLEQGEDWSEVISSQVAHLMGIPCAETRLCTRGGRRGSLSLSVVSEGHSLWEGRVLLEDAQVSAYYPHVEGTPGVDPQRPDVKRPGHSLPNIRQALTDTAPPPGFEGPDELNGYDVFAGYMLLDALIANRDRHEQNWAVLRPDLTTQPVRLSPSYDHASSLGYNLRDSKRQRCVESADDLAAWARKGTAYRFEYSGTPPTLVDHAGRAIEMCSRKGADWWRERLADCKLGPLREALMDQAIPEMSEPATRFATALLDLNLRRLRDATDTRA